MSYRDEEERKRIDRFRFKDAISLREAAAICLIKEERLFDLAAGGFAPCLLIDGKDYFFNRKEIFNWAKDNLVVHQPGSTLPKVMIVRDHSKANPYGIPEILIPIAHQLKEIQGDPHGPCIYFLISNKEVVYIGQSRSLSSRVDTHRQTKVFDRALYLPCPAETLNEVESSLIRKFKPKYNLSQVNSGLLETHRESLTKVGFQDKKEA